MLSIRSNLSALTALQSLRSTQSSLTKTQGQISTGLRVNEASHNASYWSIGVKMRSDIGALSAVKDSIKQSKAMLDTFTSALDKTLVSLNKIKQGLVSALQPGSDVAAIQTEIHAQIEGLKSIAGSATINGQNWLSGAAETVHLVVSYDGSSNKVNTLAVDTSQTLLFADASAGIGGILGDVAAFDISHWIPPLRLTGSASVNAGNSGGSLSNPAVLTGTTSTLTGLLLTGTTGNDTLLGSPGNDTLVGGLGDDLLNGGAGADEMRGGSGDDLYIVSDADDRVVEAPNEGSNDIVQSWVAHYTLPANVERLYLAGTNNIDATGNDLNNVLFGNPGANVLDAGAGNDTLMGFAGDDTIVGGGGKDVLSGGTGADTFLFTSATDTGLSGSARDVITDWESVDRLDLSAIDASTGRLGHQNLMFMGQGPATDAVGAGQVKYYHQSGSTFVVGDVSGDGQADFKIEISGVHPLFAESTATELYSDALKAVDKAIEGVIAASARMGATKAVLETQEEFISVLSDALTAGVSAFVDTDMPEVSARLQALQSQQQLGAHALAIANQNSQIVLKLFE